jgi:hypothetical protein
MPPASVSKKPSVYKPPTGRAGSFEPLHRWAVVLSPHVYPPASTGRGKIAKRGYLQEVSSFISFDYSILGKIFANGFTSTLANHFGNRVR